MLLTGLLVTGASAEPIKLKLSLVTSDRALIYRACVKPFVDAVNADAAGLLAIEVYFSGALEKQLALQPQLVSDGKADIAFIFPGYSPDRFFDNTVVELPGLFENTREASLVFTRLIAAGAMKGYDDYVVIAALSSPVESIHARLPIASIADLKGMSIRTNNPTESAVLAKLGMQPVLMTVDAVAGALSDGKIAGATAPLAMLSEFGISRVATTHYMLEISGAPLALVMNRKKFESLPPRAQDILRKYSGDWLVDGYVRAYEIAGNQVMEQLQSNSRRSIVMPSPADQLVADAAFKSVVDEWTEKSAANRAQLDIVRANLAVLRAAR
jgi:TRAP-type C4-dicarboxylate transport system substrate-binding protein